MPETDSIIMPTYGEAKTKDMIRSVLPSSARRAVRDDLAIVRRKNRRNIRTKLAKFTRETYLADDPCEEYWDYNFRGNLSHYPDAQIGYIVWDRRNSDKLAPLERWADRSTLTIEDPVARYMKVKTVLPDNTIGRHALSHIRNLDGFEEPGHNPFKYSFLNYRNHPRLKPIDYEAILLRIVEMGKESDLNDAIRAAHTPATYHYNEHWDSDYKQRIYEVRPGHLERRGHREDIVRVCECRPRVFRGLGDISTFIRDVIEAGYAEYHYDHPEWTKAAKERMKFLQQL